MPKPEVIHAHENVFLKVAETLKEIESLYKSPSHPVRQELVELRHKLDTIIKMNRKSASEPQKWVYQLVSELPL